MDETRKRIKQHCSPNVVYQVALDMLARPAPCDLVPRTNSFKHSVDYCKTTVLHLFNTAYFTKKIKTNGQNKDVLDPTLSLGYVFSMFLKFG